jgi:hypothetical protein
MWRRRYLLLVMVAVVLVGFVSISTMHRKITVAPKKGGLITIRAASLFGVIRGSRCTLAITSRTGRTGTVDLSQDYFDSPITVVPSTNDDVFFCVYDYDVDIQLLKLDLRELPQASPRSTVLGAIILATTCKIERVQKGDSNDWDQAASTLEKMPVEEFRNESVSRLDLIVLRAYRNKSSISASMRNFGNQGQYPGDTIVP